MWRLLAVLLEDGCRRDKNNTGLVGIGQRGCRTWSGGHSPSYAALSVSSQPALKSALTTMIGVLSEVHLGALPTLPSKPALELRAQPCPRVRGLSELG